MSPPLELVFRDLVIALRREGVPARWAAPSLAGHLVIATGGEARTWRAVVSPRPFRSSSRSTFSIGDLHLRAIGNAPDVPTQEEIESFVRAWRRVVSGELGTFLDLHNRETREVEPSVSGLQRLIAWGMQPGVPFLEDWVLREIRAPAGDRLRFILEAAPQDRETAIRLALDPDGPEDPRQEVLVSLPLGMLIRLPGASGEVPASDRLRVESALAFVLAMSMPPGLRFGPWAPTAPRPPSPPPRRQDDTLIIHSYRTGHEWHVPRSRFFGTWGDRDWFILLALLDRPTWSVFHGNRECQQVRQPLSDRFAHGANPFQPSRRHWSWMVHRTRFTDTDDRAAIFGGEDRLQSLLDRLEAEHPAQEVRVLLGCDAEVVGDDVPGVCRMARQEGRNVACFNPPLPRFTDASDRNWWLQFLQERDREVRPREGAVNLAGVQWPGHPVLAEIEALLALAGVEVACRMLPSHHPDLRRAVGAGQTTVLSPWFPVQEVLGGPLRDEGLPSLTLPLPYGAGPCREWCDAVARAAGKDPPTEDRWAEMARPFLSELRELRPQAARVRVALVADWGTATEMCDPSFFFGLDPLAMLSDLGFAVTVIGREASALVSRAQPALPEAVLTAVDLDPASEDPVEALRAAGPDLVYCDREDPWVAKDVGAVPFGIGDLEPGLAGAVRTLRRLLARAGLRLYRRYGAWL